MIENAPIRKTKETNYHDPKIINRKAKKLHLDIPNNSNNYEQSPTKIVQPNQQSDHN